MRKIKEVLRLKFELGLPNRQIARSCGINHSTVADYLYRAKAASLGCWPLPNLDEAELETRLFPARPSASSPQVRPAPNWAILHEELRGDKHVTLQLLWQEYKQSNPDGYQYSRFCELYQRWAGKLDLVLRQDHRAGEKLFVDYAGDTVPVIDPKTGSVTKASIFVAVQGASSYTFAEATVNQGLGSWIRSHVRALEFFGGSTALLIPDNCKTAVLHPSRYEPDLNPTYQEMAAHYGMAVIPARVRKPRDKAKVETGVLLVERWILAALRKRRFFSLADLNLAIAELLERLNDRPFRKLEGSRTSRFETLDRPALRPLPNEAYVFAEWKKARVNVDYHVEIDRHYYSAPYTLLHRQLDVRFTAMTVEIFHQGERVATHARSYKAGSHTTVNAHRPKSHQRYLEWTPERLVHWASSIGPATASLVEKILRSRPHPEQGFRSCLGILRLGKTYGPDRLEAAALRACNRNACSYQSIKSILKTGLDGQIELGRAAGSASHSSLEYPWNRLLQSSGGKTAMLMQPTLEKLYLMKLMGMAEAIRRQMENPETAQLSFEERLAMLVDQQWDWRQNKALTRRMKNARFKLEATIEDIDYRHPRRLDRPLIRSLSACDWVTQHNNLIITGPCGVGKSYLACALAQKAVRDGFAALYTRAPRLLRDLAVARVDGSFPKLLDRLARIDVLVVDDWVMAPLADSERRDFLEICDDRYRTRSTILTSQVPITHWHDQIGDPTVADSILDRLVHNAHRIDLAGASMRKTKTIRPDSAGEDNAPKGKA